MCELVDADAAVPGQAPRGELTGLLVGLAFMGATKPGPAPSDGMPVAQDIPIRPSQALLTKNPQWASATRSEYWPQS